MKRKQRRFIGRHGSAVAATLVLATLSGCGGGGGGSASGGGGGTPAPTGRVAPVGVFVTDSFSDRYDHVWVTITKVELISDAGAETVYDDANGREIDLKTLRDATGERFTFLADAKASSERVHTAVRVTFSPTLTLFAAGATTGQPVPVADGIAKDASGNAVLEFPLKAARPLGTGSDNVVIDFDLARFVVDAGKIVPALQEGAGEKLGDPERHEQERYAGTVSHLTGTAPEQTFTLTGEHGQSALVKTTAATTLFHSDASAGAALADNQRVLVTGAFDIATKTLGAKEIVVVVGPKNESKRAHARGAASNVSVDAKTFDLSIDKADDFVPQQTVLHVAVSADAVLRGDSGTVLEAAEFFTRLPGARFAEIEGTYDAASGTFTADRARVSGPKEKPVEPEKREVSVKGVLKQFNPDTHTATLGELGQWEGFVPTTPTILIAANENSEFRNGDTMITDDAFMALLKANPTTIVRVWGVWDGQKVTVKKFWLRIAP